MSFHSCLSSQELKGYFKCASSLKVGDVVRFYVPECPSFQNDPWAVNGDLRTTKTASMTVVGVFTKSKRDYESYPTPWILLAGKDSPWGWRASEWEWDSPYLSMVQESFKRFPALNLFRFVGASILISSIQRAR